MEVHILEFERVPDRVVAVRYTGDTGEGHLLIAKGWFDGVENGFNRGNAGPDVLRGRVGEKVVYPGDIISLDEDWILEVWDRDVFTRRFGYLGEIAVITDGVDNTPERDWISRLPTGINEGAINLERDPIPEGERGADEDPLNRVTEPVADEENRAESGDTTTDVQVPEHVQVGSQAIAEPNLEDPVDPDPDGTIAAGQRAAVHQENLDKGIDDGEDDDESDDEDEEDEEDDE